MRGACAAAMPRTALAAYIGPSLLMLAAMLTIAVLVVKPGRGSVVLGFLALGSWVGAMAVLVGFDLRGAHEWPGFSPRSQMIMLGASAALGAPVDVAGAKAGVKDDMLCGKGGGERGRARAVGCGGAIAM